MPDTARCYHSVARANSGLWSPRCYGQGSPARVAFGDLAQDVQRRWDLKPISDLDDDTAAMLAGIEVDTSTKGGRDGNPATTTRTAKIRRADQLKALELLGRHLGMFVTEKVEHVGAVRFVIER